MRHLILCREYPPSPYAAGGIGTYVAHISRLLAEAGETVHVVGQLWAGAPERRQTLLGGRLVVHRVPLDEPVLVAGADDAGAASEQLGALLRSESPWQAFSLQASLLAEKLIEEERIDCVEAQEYEAPLYFLQLRRALGLGPARRPPCIVHLHSPTELIFRHNGWDRGRMDYLPTKRLEDYSIGAADALLCPSHYLAGQVEEIHGLPSGSINVLRYPIGGTPVVERSASVWAGETVCYVGRLEARKGVIELVEAAVEVARRRPSVRFDFVGSDTSLSGTGGVTVQQYLQSRIPAEVASRFAFHGGQARAELMKFLGRASIAIVPSRWENFPNTCIEAMCSGAPVVATPTGGMAEMVEDGRTGWIADGAAPADIAAALLRALDTPPETRARMGEEASAAMHRLCDNRNTVQGSIAFRAELAARGAKRSLGLPPCLDAGNHAKAPLAAVGFTPPPQRVADDEAGGIALAVVVDDAQGWERCFRSIDEQRLPFACVTVVVDERRSAASAAAAAGARQRGWQTVAAGGSAVEACNAAIGAVLAGTNVLGIALIDTATCLHRDFAGAAHGVLRTRPEVGIVSFWTRTQPGDDGIQVRPCPAFPYQWLSNEVAPCAVLRASALRAAGSYREGLSGEYAQWDVVNAVLAEGWTAVTYPGVLGERRSEESWNGLDEEAEVRDPARDEMHRRLLARHPGVLAAFAPELVLHLEAGSPWSGPRSRRRGRPVLAVTSPQVLTPTDVLAAPLREKIAIARRALADPALALRWLAWHVRRARERMLGGVRASR